MKVRRFISEQDYPVVKTWWEQRDAVAPDLITVHPFGVVCEIEGILTACAFLYHDKLARTGMVEWECTDPHAGAIRTLKALNHLFAFFEDYAQNNGIVWLFSWTAEGRGDGRLLRQRQWIALPGPRHECMCYTAQATKPKTEEAPCLS